MGTSSIFRDPTGTHEITVPDDFRFTIDGKKMAVSELKPGMKGTATVTTTTTVSAGIRHRNSRGRGAAGVGYVDDGARADGNTQQVHPGRAGDKRNIEIFKDGKAVRIADLKKGDKLSAVIITTARLRS